MARTTQEIVSMLVASLEITEMHELAEYINNASDETLVELDNQMQDAMEQVYYFMDLE